MPSAAISRYLSLLLLGLAVQQAPVSAHLRRTKGIRIAPTASIKNSGRVLHEEGEGKDGKKGKGDKGKNEAVQEELDGLDRETTIAVDEDGDTLSILVGDNEGSEGEDFNFDDLEVWDRIDSQNQGTVIDVGAPVESEGTPVEEEEESESESDSESTDGNPDQILEEFVFADEQDDNFDLEYNDTLTPDYNDTVTTYYNETLPTDYNETLPTAYNETLPTDREDMNYYSNTDGYIIVTDTGIPDSSFTETDSQMEEQVLRLEIQMDTLLELNDTVAELELKLGEAMEIIARHEQLIESLSAAVWNLGEEDIPRANLSVARSYPHYPHP